MMRSKWIVAALVAALVVTLPACGGGKKKSRPVPATISITAGNGQSAVAGTELPVALAVLVADGSSRPMSGVTVRWAVTAGGGTVAPASSTTDAAGHATTRWTLGTALGTQSVTATAGAQAPAQFSATATSPGTAALISIEVTSPTGTVYEGDTVKFAATVRDADGNVIPGRTVAWSSDNASVFPISASGEMQTWGYGGPTVTAMADDLVADKTVSVVPIKVAVTLGAKEVVFDWTTDRCEDLDVPDGPARVVRSENGEFVLFAGDAPRYYASRGAGFGSLHRDCSQPVLVSKDDRTAQSYENWEWLWSFYREGSVWHALIHNEFHDTVAGICRPGDPSPANPCWYNSITHAVSTDGGRSFTKPLAPAHVVAPPVQVWTAPTASTPLNGYYYYEGYRAPTNIVRGDDGYYYSLIDLTPDKEVPGMAMCMMRTATLADPSSWRAWDGQGYNLKMESPYVTGVPGATCAHVQGTIGTASLTYNTYLRRYVLVNESNVTANGQRTCGFFFVLSSDLIHWSEPQLLAESRIQWCDTDPQKPGVLEPVFVLYSSLIDHSDTTANFEHTGQAPHLYYTRFNDTGLDRDLVRVQVTFTKTN